MPKSKVKKRLNRIALALTLLLLTAFTFQSCNTPATAETVEQETAYPNDWTASPTAGVVLEPTGE